MREKAVEQRANWNLETDVNRGTEIPVDREKGSPKKIGSQFEKEQKFR